MLNAVVHLQLEVRKSSQNLFKHPTNKNNHNYLQNHIKSISAWSSSNHQWFPKHQICYRCSESMRSCMHSECWIPVHCDATIECERCGKVRNPGYLKALWRNRDLNHMRALVAGAAFPLLGNLSLD